MRVGAQDGGRVSGINPPTAPNTPLETTSQDTAKAFITIVTPVFMFDFSDVFNNTLLACHKFAFKNCRPL